MTSAAIPLQNAPPGLLGADDPPPFQVVNPSGRARAVLLCDHASWAVPAALDNLGLDHAVLRRHIGWDIGAADVTRELAGLLDATAVLAGYSRLVIDCNRPPGAPGSIPAISDGVAVPGNQALDGEAARSRRDACFTPYHQAVEAAVTRAGEMTTGSPPAPPEPSVRRVRAWCAPTWFAPPIAVSHPPPPARGLVLVIQESTFVEVCAGRPERSDTRYPRVIHRWKRNINHPD